MAKKMMSEKKGMPMGMPMGMPKFADAMKGKMAPAQGQPPMKAQAAKGKAKPKGKPAMKGKK